jgi:hypothetical protein
MIIEQAQVKGLFFPEYMGDDTRIYTFGTPPVHVIFSIKG